MKKLLYDSCAKTAFLFDNVLCKQCDGLSMGSSLDPLLANIILTEVENVIVKPVAVFCYRHLDNTIVTIKKNNIKHILHLFISFHKNLRFTVDIFDNVNICFLDIKILDNGKTDISIKATNTGTYVYYHSYEHCNTKTA